VRAALLCLLIGFPCLAWEPASPADVQSRIVELERAWAGKSPEQIALDKATRSRQQKPAWVARGAWKLELGPVTYYFAVGKAGFGAARTSAAPRREPSGNGRPLDWWYDDAAGALYTLVVDAR
jgi:hypothetical protein